jgi:hypothetical protein
MNISNLLLKYVCVNQNYKKIAMWKNDLKIYNIIAR